MIALLLLFFNTGCLLIQSHLVQFPSRSPSLSAPADFYHSDNPMFQFDIFSFS